MSVDLNSGVDSSLTKRHYDNIDYTQLSFAGPFAGIEQSYVVGTTAYIADTTLPTTKLGWTIYTPKSPLPYVYQALGLTFGPAFEAKDILFLASNDCLVSFDDPARTQILIPANTYMRFHTRCFVLYATQAAGTLDIWCEG